MRVYVEPRFDMTTDTGEGGIKQVIRHVTPYLEAAGIEFVDTPAAAHLTWYHATPYATTRHWLEQHPEQPVVCSMHGLYWAEYDWDQGSLDANADVIEGMRLADVVTAPSQWVADAVHRGILHDVRVVPHGVDLAEFAPPEDGHDAYVLYDKTRVDPVCDPTPVIELARRMPDVKFVMTGDPPVALPNVMALGRLPYEQAAELTRNAAVYLCVTRETFGLATLQAMACGVPVVGYRYGGQAEICPTREHGGWLTEPGDIEGLVKGVGTGIAHRDVLSAAARVRAKEYTWQRAADGYLAAMQAAIDAHASKVRCTVITTAYNAERTVGRTIASVLKALGPDDEYIIVDDASTDGTRKRIADLHRDERITFIARTENGYLAQARNDALRIARGRYVTCLDADDELPPDALNTLAGELDKDRTCQIAYGKVYFMGDYPNTNGTIDERPEEYTDAQGRSLGPGRSQWPFPYDPAVQLQGSNVTCMPYSAMVRTAWLKRAGGWRTRCRTGEDIDLWMRLVAFGARPKMVTEADCLIYHTSTTSMSITHRLPDWGKWYPWTEAAGQVCMPPWGIAAANGRQRAWPVGHQANATVTVVIPCGPGHDRYVLDAVDSVMAQTYRRWRCIVVNDTGQPLATRLPAWVEIIEGASSIEAGAQGVATARNAGLAAVATPYTVFLDADDWLDRDALAYLVASLEARPDLAVVYPDYWERDPVPDNSGTGYVAYSYGTRKELPDWSCDEGAKAGALYAITAIYRTEALRAVGGFDPEAQAMACEDGDLQMALAYAGYCAGHLPRRAFVYARDRGSVAPWHYGEEQVGKFVGWLRKKYEGKKVACGSCGGGRVSPPPMSPDGMAEPLVLSGNMYEVEYTGPMGGSFTIRGAQSGMESIFQGKGSRAAVLAEDVAFFDASPDYTVHRSAAPQAPDAQPSLTVDGPPHGRRAAVA